ncbi:Rab proteins geranylgeranyltransferase component A [Nakaseomyces bracarensis]|uniref:Rab proteins geranylgeranyltransferase component A n=1 Tax=Nakaseomyces bracarensis TaxID=273131 RepID=A0ABR4NTG5_9SACH
MLSPERRPSMAERRPSMLYDNGMNQISTTLIPHLAGIEDPLPENTPEKVDVLIIGTGMVESVLAAALSWQGSSVLHIDKNDYYGDTSATLTVDQVKRWVKNINNGSLKGYTNAKLYVSNLIGNGKYASRDFGIDLSPKILFAKSDLLSILIKSRVYQYLEFQSLSNFHTYENDSFEKLTNSKQEIFTDQKLPLMTKRNLMRFIKFVFDWENHPDIWKPYQDKPLDQFLTEKFKLERAQISELVFSIGLCYNHNAKMPAVFQRIRRYLSSFDVYGPFPVLYSKYGGAGEVSQGFCRSAAVGGATYKLNESLRSYNPSTQVATFSDGSNVTVTEKVIVSPTQSPPEAQNIPDQKYEVHRLTCIVDKPCLEWFNEGESAAVVVFPPGSLKSQNTEVVQVLILGPGSETCPDGTCIWYLSTSQDGPKAELDLDAALEAMEISILRESSTELENDNEIVQFSNNGHTIVNSVKLGQSFREYVPRERLQFLFKLYYTQFTSTPPFDVVNPAYFDTKKFSNGKQLMIPGASDNGVIYSPMPSVELSYDEVITAAKVLYEKIVGSDDDFFDVDFEDEEEMNGNGTMTNENGTTGVGTQTNAGIANPIIYENAIVDDDDESQDIEMDNEMHDDSEFVGEMEI